MDHQPLVSILINNYNYGRFLDDAITSALSQTYSNVEVIVVDDGSTDNSAEIIAKYEGRIKAIFKENGGQASAFNAGFAASAGEIICFLDSDDAYKPEKVERVISALFDDALGYCFDAVVLTGPDLIPQSPDDIRSNKIHVVDYRANMRAGSLSRCLAMPIPATSGLSFRRSVLEGIFPLPESESCSMSENYMKYIAVGTERGVFMETSLTLQRLHGKNLFTVHMEPSMGARISILCGYWMHKNYPDLSKFADTQIALGLHLASRSENEIDSKYWEYVREHMKARGCIRAILIRARAFSYTLRKALKGHKA